MIAACPRCSTRFRIGAERLRDEGVRLRCTQCQVVFRVYPPLAAAPHRRDDPAVEAELTPPPRPLERERMVLVADPDAARAKTSGAEIGRLGLHPLLVHDGVEALLVLQRSLPARLLVDLSLPRLSGAELCEIVKRNDSLRSIHIVATGSAETFRSLAALRAAGLGPDTLLEHADLPEGLSDALRLSRVEREETEPKPASTFGPESLLDSESEVLQAPPAATAASAESNPEITRAERLARIVVSDIVLYNADRFEQAARDGDVLDALAVELAEGRTLFRQRVPEELWETRDFLAEELLRVAQVRASR